MFLTKLLFFWKDNKLKNFFIHLQLQNEMQYASCSCFVGWFDSTLVQQESQSTGPGADGIFSPLILYLVGLEPHITEQCFAKQ